MGRWDETSPLTTCVTLLARRRAARPVPELRWLVFVSRPRYNFDVASITSHVHFGTPILIGGVLVFVSLFPLDLARDAYIRDLSWARNAICGPSTARYHLASAPDSDALTHLSPDAIARAESDYRRAVDTARAICASCPVIGECLGWALAHNETGGVWGGLTGPQRARILRSRARARTASAAT